VQDKEPKGIIPLENVQVREVTASGHKPHCFEIHSKGNDVIKACKTDSEGKVVEGTQYWSVQISTLFLPVDTSLISSSFHSTDEIPELVVISY